MRSIIIFILLSGFALQVSAQKKRSSWRNEWRNNIIKIDDDLLANSEGFRYVRSKDGRAFPFWNMGDYVVIDSKQIRPVTNVLDFRPVFISEIFVERDFQASAFHYSTQGPEGYGAVTKLIYQNYRERSNTEILGSKMPYREFRVTMTAEILPNTNQGMWRIESTHSYGNKFKDKGYVEFFGYIYNEQDTVRWHWFMI